VLDKIAAYGAPVIPAKIARTADEAVQAASAFEGALALKILSPDIPHKTEAGGVRLNVAGAAQARAAFDEIIEACRAYAPEARIEGVIVSPMRPPGVELIVGVTRDPHWGPAIVVGLGGVLTEVLKDSQARLLPVSASDVLQMLGDLKGAALLKGFRGTPPADLDKLAQAIVAIGNAALALGPDLAALEVNPLWVGGDRVECLDGLAIFEAGGGRK